MSTGALLRTACFHRFKRSTQPRLRLLCFPYAGGSAHIFRDWANVLPPEIELLAYQPPGRGSRLAERPAASIASTTEAVYESILPYLNSPFAFFGHSMGALIAFELVRELRRGGELAPVRLCVSAHRAPHLYSQAPQIHDLPDALFLQKVRDLKGTPNDVLANEELVHLLLPALRADFRACETYRYRNEPPLSCPITVYGGILDSITREELAAWRIHTTSQSQLRLLPGNHFFLHSHGDLLLKLLVQDLSRDQLIARGGL